MNTGTNIAAPISPISMPRKNIGKTGYNPTNDCREIRDVIYVGGLRMRNITQAVVASAALAVWACFVTPALAAKPLEDAKWIEVTTSNFQVTSVLNEKKTIGMVRHLELLRVAFLNLTNAEHTDAPIPTRIYAAGKNDFKLLGLSRNFIGSFQAGIRDNTILILNTTWADESTVIMHEYVHFLLRNYSGVNYPRWYDEGFAEYFASSEIRGKFFVVGSALESRIPGLVYSNWIAGDKLLSSSSYSTLDDDDRSLFYGQAWLLVHYLQNSEEKAAQFPDDMDRYIAMTASGRGEKESFEEVFQIKSQRLRGTLSSYLNRKCCNTFRFRIDELLPKFLPSVRQLSRTEAALRLGQLALKRGKSDIAMSWFETAMTSDATRARALSDSAGILLFRDEFDEAEKRLQDGIALAPDDPYIHLNLAKYWVSRAAAIDDLDRRAQYIDKAQRGILSAWEIDTTIPEIYALNGQAYLIGKQDIDKSVKMLEEAVRLLPSVQHIRLMLAHAYMDAGRNDDAVTAARSVIAWSHGENSQTRLAQEIIKLANGAGN
jgi:tetratricopeptide (TPR) repeat protein